MQAGNKTTQLERKARYYQWGLGLRASWHPEPGLSYFGIAQVRVAPAES